MMGQAVTVHDQAVLPPAASRRGEDRNIFDRIGWRRTGLIVWHATPWPWRPIAFPYGLIVYRRLFAASDTLRYLHAMHATQYDCSWLFRLMRPRYRRIEQLLRQYGLSDETRGERKGR